MAAAKLLIAVHTQKTPRTTYYSQSGAFMLIFEFLLFSFLPEPFLLPDESDSRIAPHFFSLLNSPAFLYVHSGIVRKWISCLPELRHILLINPLPLEVSCSQFVKGILCCFVRVIASRGVHKIFCCIQTYGNLHIHPLF